MLIAFVEHDFLVKVINWHVTDLVFVFFVIYSFCLCRHGEQNLPIMASSYH